MTKTKLEKLRQNLEDAKTTVKESFDEYDKVYDSKKPNMTSIETAEYIVKLVKTVVTLTESMSKALSAYSKYTAALEFKCKIFPKDDSGK